jgi:hypothetical protein
MGGSGDYFADADTVIVMDNYTPSDQTAAAHSIAAQHVATLAAAGVQQPAPAAGVAAAVWVTPRAPLRVYAGPEDSRGVKTHVRGLHHIQASRRSCCNERVCMYQSDSSTTNDPAGAVTCVVHACVLVCVLFSRLACGRAWV